MESVHAWFGEGRMKKGLKEYLVSRLFHSITPTWMLFRYRLVPRVISVVGLIGYALMFFASIVGWFDLVDLTPSTSGWDVLALPVAVFEIILLPFWLLFKGFKTPEAPEHPAAA